MASPIKHLQAKQPFKFEAVMLFWRIITQIFFREIRPRGAFHIPRDGPVIFVGAPHHNQVCRFSAFLLDLSLLLQFLDPLLLSLEVFRETRRQVQFLTAARSMERKWVGFFARLMDSSEFDRYLPLRVDSEILPVPVARAADSAKPAAGRIWLSPNDPCLILGEGTQFTKDFLPKMQIMLPKSINNLVAEVSEVLSDTELLIKREFGGESGKGTAKIREQVMELRQDGISGLEFKKMPYVDQNGMYREVYQCLNDYGSIGIFPEGESGIGSSIL